MGGVLAAATLATTPLLLAALGGLINRRGGIINIALEGKMLLGALVAVWGSALTGSWVAGLALAVGAGAALGLLFSLSITRLGANEIIAGLGFTSSSPARSATRSTGRAATSPTASCACPGSRFRSWTASRSSVTCCPTRTR